MRALRIDTEVLFVERVRVEEMRRRAAPGTDAAAVAEEHD